MFIVLTYEPVCVAEFRSLNFIIEYIDQFCMKLFRTTNMSDYVRNILALNYRVTLLSVEH